MKKKNWLKNKMLKMVLVAMLIVGLFAGSGPAWAQESPAGLSVGPVSGSPGATIDVPVNLTSAGLRGVQFQLSYDPQLLSYQGVKPGSLVPDFDVTGKVKEGTVKVVIASISGNNIPGGAGTVALLSFKVSQSAQQGQNYSLTLGGTILADMSGSKVEGVTENSGQLTISGGSTNPPGSGGGGGGGGSQPPEVEKLEPAEGAKDVELNAAVTVSFKQYVSVKALDKIFITNKGGNKVTNVKPSVDGKVLTIAHDAFAYEDQYTVNIPADVLLRSDNAIENKEIKWSFSTKKKSVVTEKPAVEPEPQQQFSDLPSNHWAYGVISSLFGSGIVGGYPDGTFKPEKSVTRAEFVKMLTKAMGMPDVKPGNPSFSDVLPGDWCYGCIEAAVGAGLVKGDETGDFRPDSLITREEMAVVLIQAMKKESVALASSGEKTSFADDGSISGWARGFVVTAIREGLVSGYPEDNTFRPANNATRAEACAIIVRLLPKV
ncbi:MAG: S-layer homology domain-containing protein [Desulfocucumaceae bacterium]